MGVEGREVVGRSLAAAESPTWGISGPTFIGIYVALLVLAIVLAVVLAVAVRGRAWMWRTSLPAVLEVFLPRWAWGRQIRGPVRPPVEATDLAPVELAYLAGDVDHATFVAVMRLEESKAIDLSGAPLRSDLPILDQIKAARGGRVRVTGMSTASLHPVESAVVHHLEDGRKGAGLYPEMRADPAVQAMREDMTARGFVVGAARAWRIRLGAVPIGAVMMLGLLRLWAGIANGKPVLFLVMALIASAFALFIALRVPRLTTAGFAVVDEYKQRYSEAVQQMRDIASETRPDERVRSGFWAERRVDVRAVAAMGTPGMVIVSLSTDLYSNLLPEISSSDLQLYAEPQNGFVMGPFGFGGSGGGFGGGGGGGCGG